MTRVGMARTILSGRMHCRAATPPTKAVSRRGGNQIARKERGANGRILHVRGNAALIMGYVAAISMSDAFVVLP